MVKRMIVVLSALALIMTAAGMACAFFPVVEGSMIMVPMKVITKFEKKNFPGGFSSFFTGRGCPQYTHPAGFWPWGIWKGTKCVYSTQIKPPKCIAPAYGGPVAWGAPTPVMPGAKLVKSVEKFGIKSPGCNPCVTGGLAYQIVKKQVVK
jgi:hypothetical protein